MKKGMTKMLLLALMLITSSNMWAYDFEVDNIRYTIKSANEVWVARYDKFGNNLYEGDIVVPDEVVNQGTTYKVTGVEMSAFSNNQNITSVTLNNNVKIIDQKAFSGSTKLQKVVLGMNVEKIKDEAFYHCESLTSIQLPETLTEIGTSAFGSSGLTSIVIPDKVTTLGEYIFTTCYDLAWVKIGTGVTVIPNSTFSSCSSLKSISIPDNVKTIDKQAFTKTPLETIYFGKGITNIERLAFGGCNNLKTVYSASATPFTMAERVFYLVNLAAVNLVVPTGSKSAYQNADTWKEFGTISEMDNIETADIKQVNTRSNMQGIYDSHGRQLPAMQKGLNIVKMSNGETRKVVVK